MSDERADQSPSAPQYGQPSAYDPYGASPRNPSGAQKTSTLAILSIVFALGGVFIWPIIILTSPAGAVMGHLALGRIKQTGEQGRGLALAGIIGGWVLTGLYILIAIAVEVSRHHARVVIATPGQGFVPDEITPAIIAIQTVGQIRRIDKLVSARRHV